MRAYLFRIESDIGETARCRACLGYADSIRQSQGIDLTAIFKLEPFNSSAGIYFAIGIEKILDPGSPFLELSTLAAVDVYEDDVPGQWDNYKKINTEFFIELGSPGGASKVGETNSDHEDVTALAPKTS